MELTSMLFKFYYHTSVFFRNYKNNSIQIPNILFIYRSSELYYTFPCLLFCRTDHICLLEYGSTPAVGSSKIIICNHINSLNSHYKTNRFMKQQGRQCTCSVPLRNVHVTIVAADKQQVLHIMNVCL